MKFKINKPDSDVMQNIIDNPTIPFAMLYRPEAYKSSFVDIFRGEFSIVDKLEDIVLRNDVESQNTYYQEKLILIPYRQIAEKGFEATDDNTPLVVMDINKQEIKTLDNVITALPSCDITLENDGFDIDDSTYESIVDSIIKNEIGQGKGASFVIKRSYIADVSNFSTEVALSIFKKLLVHETGSYWTFIIHTGERTLIGATPERHVALENGIASMNPISGTYRYPSSGPNISDVTEFLRDKKEIDELYIVVDEELKMMSKACDNSVWVDGPMLKEMSNLAHTEYIINGSSTLGPLQILKETMFAPTVMGGPLESAARVIHEYEPDGRGYYSGVIGLIGKKNNEHVIDSSIIIRTADINKRGKMKISVGATLVMGSNPADEASETRTKLSSLLSALGVNKSRKLSTHPEISELLSNRNKSISDFWLKDKLFKFTKSRTLSGKRILIVDAEDSFTSMIKLQLISLGCFVKVRRFNDNFSLYDNYDLVILGPGPGDPNDINHVKISSLFNFTKDLLNKEQPFLSICLSHQILSSIMGLKLLKKDIPNQGIQKEINLFDKKERVGFYNTFSAYSSTDEILNPITKETVEVSRDPISNEVNAIRGSNFCGIQFHAESLLTIDGVRIFNEIITRICNAEKNNKSDSNIRNKEVNNKHNISMPVYVRDYRSKNTNKTYKDNVQFFTGQTNSTVNN